MTASGRAAGNHSLGRNCNTDHGRICTGTWLHDAVDMVYIVAVRRNVLCIDRKYIGETSGCTLHDIQKSFAGTQNIPLLDRLGDGKAACIDYTISLGGVD